VTLVAVAMRRILSGATPLVTSGGVNVSSVICGFDAVLVYVRINSEKRTGGGERPFDVPINIIIAGGVIAVVALGVSLALMVRCSSAVAKEEEATALTDQLTQSLGESVTIGAAKRDARRTPSPPSSPESPKERRRSKHAKKGEAVNDVAELVQERELIVPRKFSPKRPKGDSTPRKAVKGDTSVRSAKVDPSVRELALVKSHIRQESYAL
jgi:hypothetical protein